MGRRPRSSAAAPEPRIIGTIQFKGLDDPVTQAQLLGAMWIELRHLGSGQVIGRTNVYPDSMSKEWKFHFTGYTDGRHAVDFPHEVRYGDIIARLQTDRKTQIVEVSPVSPTDATIKVYTLETVEYAILPGRIKWQIFDDRAAPLGISPTDITILTDHGIGKVSNATTLKNGWYEAYVSPGAYTLVCPEAYSDTTCTPNKTYRVHSGPREQSFFVGSERTHVASTVRYALYTPPVTTGTIKWQVFDPNGKPFSLSGITLLADSNQTVPVPNMSANGWYEASVPPGAYTLVFPETFADPTSSTAYQLQSGPRVQSFSVQAGQSVVAQTVLYERFLPLTYSVNTDSGAPASGRSIRVLNSITGQLIGEGVTDSTGTATILLKQVSQPAQVDVLVYDSGIPLGPPVSSRRLSISGNGTSAAPVNTTASLVKDLEAAEHALATLKADLAVVNPSVLANAPARS